MNPTCRPLRDVAIAVRCACLASATLVCGPAAADLPAPLWGPHIDVEAKPGSKRTLGEADLFLPLAQDARTLVFGNLRARFDNQSSREGNLGVGVRHMLDSGWNLGAYGYRDRRRSSDTGNYYDQATVGAEALGRDWDFRINSYLPQGTRVRDLGTTPGVSSATISGASIIVTTTAGITREERVLKGSDAELGWRAPIFDSEAAQQLRIYAGGYRFGDGVMTVKGPRLRAELAMDDLTWFGSGTALFLGLESQHDSARGHQNFLSVRLRIPLGKGGGSARALNAQERRMAAPVIRDVDIVTQSRSFVSTPASTETATATADGHAVTVVDSATTTGAGLQAALNAAGSNSMVVFSGTFNTTGSLTLQAGQTVMGTGTVTVRTPSGHTASVTLASGATINASIAANNVAIFEMADNSTLTGMTLNRNEPAAGTPRAVDVIGVSNVTVSNNTISLTAGNTNAFGIFVDHSSNVTVSGNTVSASRPGAIGMALYARDSSLTVAGNTLSATGTTGYAAYLVADPAAALTVLSGSTGNVFTNGSCFTFGTGTFTGSFAYTAAGVPGVCPP